MVRMWMVPTEMLCHNHLLGEHNELHKLYGQIKNKHNISGRISTGQVELGSIQSRHEELVLEFKRRNYNHNSPLLISEEQINHYPDKGKARRIGNVLELMRRCKSCRRRMR